MVPERWVGYIKVHRWLAQGSETGSGSPPPPSFFQDYDGGTLMECAVCAAVPYLNVPGMIRAQRERVQALVRAASHEAVWPGLQFPEDGSAAHYR